MQSPKSLIGYMAILTLLVFATGCEQAPKANTTPTKAPAHVEDLRKNPQVPPAQAEYLMGGGSKPANR
jgi:PBP1b-binding outer membrane lipoprotein LpoB